MRKVLFISLGCDKNLADSEEMLGMLVGNGYEITNDESEAEAIVINTCAFIHDAKEESVNSILEMARYKETGQLKALVVTGCLAQRYQKEIIEEIPEVDAVLGTGSWDELIQALDKVFEGEKYLDFQSIDRIPQAEGKRVITTGGHYDYLKIAEGCNRTCSYCSIPIITGKYQSRPMEEIINEVEWLVGKGVKEFQVIAQDLTFYGYDRYKKAALPELIERISDIKGVEWIRLHYGYPTHFPMDLLRVMRERENVCKYMDIALQHISDKMLKLMRRNITKEETLQLISAIREEVPGIHLRTTLMVGHPGETETDFAELVDFVKEIRFERMGAFAYSHEIGTYAYKNYSDDIPEETKQERLDTLMALQEKIANEINLKKTGKVFKTIIDREEDDLWGSFIKY